MKIYTKKGDKGTTSLLGGGRIPKDDIRLEAFGTLDELTAYLGLIRSLAGEERITETLLRIQKDLMTASAAMASGDTQRNTPTLQEEEIAFLEKEIDHLNALLPPLTHFIIPGNDTLASHCHIARTICRRAERRTVPLFRNDHSLNTTVQFLNRLSDYLFVLARYVAHKKNKNETYW